MMMMMMMMMTMMTGMFASIIVSAPANYIVFLLSPPSPSLRRQHYSSFTSRNCDDVVYDDERNPYILVPMSLLIYLPDASGTPSTLYLFPRIMC